MDFPFKITQEAGTYQFLHVKANPEHRTIQDSNLQLQVYLTLTRRLSLGLECYALLPYSPVILELWPDAVKVAFGYHLLADDFNGLGIDKGFQPAINDGPEMVLITLKDLMTLRSIPEDSLGENASAVSLFLLHPGREIVLKKLLQAQIAPFMARFLQKNELFIHLTCGKEQGYYDGMLIRSQTDITMHIQGAIQLTQTAGLL
ncbi:hypothetical protein DIU31_022600 [Mucilaginibacter rubeus]|uniref:Uncharacterized protein n=2 Tax=Mucilaginibacter rubeus TaxID=2027860 RepID=A0A364WWG5_9SPHI|nr:MULTISPECIES: hypothetical protein [Mucilaginibacter]QEM06168.1 hypothetical protein DIU31_022600 [Mucilaginibacter rubeus]QEM13685.1 hypothetical protein DEO27_027955 [Mucilaginibacter rubeus]QEM18750.1 hypothetical protein DIU38_022835 [Mucilaginibacter gossypii]QTE36256.1 hypothetical protein J3L18_24465 [Mucilaginibacter gossypii]QTE44709.1 hypothetical protein J3L19_04890 [Mucilaginibacter rubeus]